MRHEKASTAVWFAWLVALSLSGLVMDAAADGLPGEYVITQRWRELSSHYSALSNPAFLTQENYLTVHGAMSSVLQNFLLTQAGATLPLGLYQSLGLNWTNQSAEKIGVWVDGGHNNDSLAEQRNHFTGSYAINPWNGVSLGINLNLIQHNSFGDQGIGGGADLGISYRLLKHPLIGTHLLGGAIQNVLTLPLVGAFEEADKYARIFRATLYSTYFENLVESNFDFCLKDLFPKDTVFLPDSVKDFEMEISGRLGVAVIQMFRLYAMAGVSKTGLEHWGAGLTVNAPSVYQGRDILFGYQLLQVSKNDKLSNSFYARVNIGPHREEVFARSDKLDVAPNAIYLKALKLYREGNYWDAYFLFSQILNEYPDFFNNDWVLFYTGSCQEKMDMREIALFTYKALEIEYPFSNAMIPARLSEMRIHYRNEDYEKVESMHAQLQEATVADSMKYSADYIMGQTHIARKEFDKAVELLSRIHPSHGDYLFAQHSIAVAQINLDNYSEAMLNLQNCITESPKDKERKEVINRSYLLLGYLLYENPINEEKPLSKAVAMLREIPAQSIYYDEATLALGWCAIKAQQFEDCIKTGTSLRSSINPLYHFEGAVISAYGYMMQQKFNEAKEILVDISQKIETLRPVSEDSIALEKQRYLDTRASYDFLAKRVAECAQKPQSGEVLQENASLHNEQKQSMDRINASLSYFDSYKKGLFLTRNYEQIKQEISYMLAVVSGRTVDTEQYKKFEKVKEKEKDIDKEIEKLQKEMEKIDEKQNGK
ncbi:MAG: tetratricopeptide repeat protein [Chitinispirillaceae bacterium]|nr:tetratricopeptide repeat protein [Chitinispirillaceae bacterium]